LRSFIPGKIGSAWIAVDAAYVQEILGACAWVPIPHASPSVPGVFAWHGRAIAIYDLARLVDSGDALRPGLVRPRSLIVGARGCTLAMPIDSVREVRELDGPQVQASHATRLRHSSTEIELFGSMAAVLDVPSIVEGVLVESGEHDR
jgi:chemotaxis signal transduction protein